MTTDSKLTLKLRSDSGYSSSADYRINVQQWSAILTIAEGRLDEQQLRAVVLDARGAAR